MYYLLSTPGVSYRPILFGSKVSFLSTSLGSGCDHQDSVNDLKFDTSHPLRLVFLVTLDVDSKTFIVEWLLRFNLRSRTVLISRIICSVRKSTPVISRMGPSDILGFQLNSESWVDISHRPTLFSYSTI